VTFENQSRGKHISPEDLDKLEFDEWRGLYDRDPELFEHYRKLLLERQIQLAPESSKPRLLGLIFQMEAEAIRSRTPISYNLRLSAMMMDNFEQLRQQLALLTGAQTKINAALNPIRNSAEIIPFDRTRSEQK